MSNNLDLDQVSESQDSKEVTINDQAGQIDAAITEQYTIEVTSTNTWELTSEEFSRNVYFIIDVDSSDPADADITITCPAEKRGIFIVKNSSEYAATITIPEQSLSAPVVESGSMTLLSCDGSNIESQSTSGENPFDVGSSFAGVPEASEIILEFIFTRAVTFPSGLTGSQGSAGTAATAEAIFDIIKDETSVGSMTFAASGTVPTFAMTTATVFAAGEVLQIIGPSTADATLADIVFTLAGAR